MKYKCDISDISYRSGSPKSINSKSHMLKLD